MSKIATSQCFLHSLYAEELSFSAIYLCHPRSFNLNVRATPFMTVTIEIRRQDTLLSYEDTVVESEQRTPCDI